MIAERYKLLRQCSRGIRSEEHTSELQSQSNLVCRLLLEKKNTQLCQPRHAVVPDALLVIQLGPHGRDSTRSDRANRLPHPLILPRQFVLPTPSANLASLS